MDVKYPICYGVDVDKTFLVAVIKKDSQPKLQLNVSLCVWNNLKVFHSFI